MKPAFKLLSFILFISFTLNGSGASPQINISSPDGRLNFLISSTNQQLTMSVTLNGKRVTEPSPILMSVDGNEITTGIKQGRVRRFSADETFPLSGLHSSA